MNQIRVLMEAHVVDTGLIIMLAVAHLVTLEKIAKIVSDANNSMPSPVIEDRPLYKAMSEQKFKRSIRRPQTNQLIYSKNIEFFINTN